MWKSLNFFFLKKYVGAFTTFFCIYYVFTVATQLSGLFDDELLRIHSNKLHHDAFLVRLS